MKIAVLFGSQRMGGTNAEIESIIRELPLEHEITFIHMAENRVEGCAACHCCAQTGRCVLPPGANDRFQQILDCFITSDMIFIITPVYAGIPSRLTALLERMTSVFYDSGVMNTPKNPLCNKKAAIVSYCSAGICDETALKIIFQKFLMTGYSFTEVNYDYLNSCGNPGQKYGSVVDYIKDILLRV